MAFLIQTYEEWKNENLLIDVFFHQHLQAYLNSTVTIPLEDALKLGRSGAVVSHEEMINFDLLFEDLQKHSNKASRLKKEWKKNHLSREEYIQKYLFYPYLSISYLKSPARYVDWSNCIWDTLEELIVKKITAIDNEQEMNRLKEFIDFQFIHEELRKKQNNVEQIFNEWNDKSLSRRDVVERFAKPTHKAKALKSIKMCYCVICDEIFNFADKKTIWKYILAG